VAGECVVKIRRRAKPEGAFSPKEQKLRDRIEEAERRRKCITWVDAEGHAHDFHEAKAEMTSLTFTWDPKFRRSVSPVECVHCGRKGFYVILELGDHWDDPLAAKESKAS
jgi:hypothetical protein